MSSKSSYSENNGLDTEDKMRIRRLEEKLENMQRLEDEYRERIRREDYSQNRSRPKWLSDNNELKNVFIGLAIYAGVSTFLNMIFLMYIIFD